MELITQYAWVGPAVAIMLVIALSVALRARRQALNSVAEITQELRALTSEQPPGRLEATGRSEELADLVASVNDVLEKEFFDLFILRACC